MRSWARTAIAMVLVAGFVAPQSAHAQASPGARRLSRPPGVAQLPPSPADPSDPITDQTLRNQIAALAHSRSMRVDAVPTIAVEVLTSYSADVEQAVRRLGGVVTGAVAGQVVQARMPVVHVGDLALTDGVSFVRAPKLVTRPPTLAAGRRSEVGPGFGTTVGQNVALTGADGWQAAGVAGAVKVGVIDYFDLGLWSAAEEGPVPDAAHRFCQDSSGSPQNICAESNNAGINNGDGFEHGVAVAQVVKDMAPAAELFLASTGTVSDLKAAIDWFAQNGVRIVTRSLGAAYDGPGDGTGPLASVVDYATSRGITWFNSAGNDAADGYARITVAKDLSATGGYIDFDNGPGVDTYLRISGRCVLFDGIRWSEWGVPPKERTDYVVEAWAPVSNPDLAHDENYNPTDLAPVPLLGGDQIQSSGAPPLELADATVCAPNSFGFANGIIYIRIKRKANTPTSGPLDTLEVALGSGFVELHRSQAPYSAAKPVVDSANPGLIAVGAIDPANGSGSPDAIAYYSSQGPTNDGRIKPDVSAPSCLTSTIYPSCFNGTSAASPTAAGMAALLLDAGVALAGAPLAAAMRHFTFDRPFNGGIAPPDGPDNKYGSGQIRMPTVPAPAPAVMAAAYHPLTPLRLIDTRIPTSDPAQGVQRPYGILDVTMAGVGGVPADASAVAINITSTEAVGTGFVQAIPYLRSAYGSSSTLNIVIGGATRPNFAIVPIGAEGRISIYTVPGGNVIVDILGYFSPTGATVAAGRLVPIDPVRVLDTRSTNLVPAGWVAHKPAGEAVVVPAAANVPTTGVSALVLNVTSTESVGDGFLRAEPTGTSPLSSTVNYRKNTDAANTVIVALGADGTASVFTNNVSHIVVDVTGYITDASAPIAAVGRFVPMPTTRAYDSRNPPETVLGLNGTRTVPLTGFAPPAPVVPAGATGISINLTAADEAGSGFMVAYPSGGSRPSTSSLNFVTGQPVANGALLKLSAGGALDLFTNQQTGFIIDVNGYFT